MSDVKVSIKDLSGKFNLINFINKLNTTKETNISTLTKQFESTIQDLQKIKRKVQHKIDDLEDKEKAAEDTRTNNALALNKSFLDITVEFNSLETRLNQVGNTAVRIGEQLETIDKQRSKAVDAKELIQYFLDFDKGDSKKLTQLRKTDEYKAVIIAKRLNAIAKEISIPGTEVARANIEKYCENLERSLLSLFDEALKKKDRELMKQTASTLFDFNGGNSCLQTYINLSSFFINKNVMGVETELYTTFAEEEENINESKWVKIPQCDPSLLRLYMEVRETCLKEWETISFVFPNSEYVMQQFVQRIFAQSIQAHLETLLTQARETSQLSFLRILSSSHAETEKLIRDLYQFDEDVIKVTALRPVLSAILDRAFEDLFVPYVEGDRWLSVECKSFEERVERVLSNFLVFVAHRTKNFNRKGTKSAYSPLNIHIPLPQPSKEASSATSMLNRMMGDNSSQIVKAGDENGIPDVETCIKILKIHVEVIVRCKQLVPMNLLHTRITQLFKLLITYFHHYIEAACIIANEDFLDTTPNSKTQPTPKYYPLIQSTSQILKLLQFHFQSIIAPLLTNPAIHREMVVFKNEFIGNVEGRLNELLLKQVDAISDWILYILGKQKKIDYKPKDEASAVSTLATLPCIQICEFIKKTYQHVSTYLDGENSKIFLSEIGSNLHSHLLDHYKKFTVSASGGMILSKDLSKYQQTIAQLHLPNLTQRFEILRELGLLFVTKPESLKTVLSEGKYLSRIELSLIYPYAQMREDWGGMRKFEKEIFNVESGSRNNSIKVDAVGVDD